MVLVNQRTSIRAKQKQSKTSPVRTNWHPPWLKWDTKDNSCLMEELSPNMECG